MNPARNRPRASEAEPTRAANDLYPTPQPLCDAICRKLRETIGEVTHVVEPSAGTGNFVRPRGRRGRHRASPRSSRTPRPPTLARMRGASGQSFEDAADAFGASVPLWPRALVLGNPPFDRAESHVRIALDRLGHFTATAPQPRWLAFVLRASFLAGQKRTAGLWTEAPARYVWHLAPRPSFTADGKTDGAEYVLCVWMAGHRGSYEGGWLNWRGT
jgi:hypothetical protein